jgi:hypothetical protein
MRLPGLGVFSMPLLEMISYSASILAKREALHGG